MAGEPASASLFALIRMRVYLDNCAINRPFDDQTQPRIKSETVAVIEIRAKLELGMIDLVWSYLHEFEISRNPFSKIQAAALEWKQMAKLEVVPSLAILKTSYDLRDLRLKPIDSLHLAAASTAGCSYFITTDDGILSKLTNYRGLKVRGPVDFVNAKR